MLLARGEFALILVALATEAGLDPRLTPFVALYVLVLAVASPIMASQSRARSLAAAASGSRRGQMVPDRRLTSPASPRRISREQEDQEAQAAGPAEQGQPRQASARRPPLDRSRHRGAGSEPPRTVTSSTRATTGASTRLPMMATWSPDENMSTCPRWYTTWSTPFTSVATSAARTSGSDSVTAAATTTTNSARLSSPTSRIRCWL